MPHTGGRVAGTPNRATAEIKELARRWGPEAIQHLAVMAGLAAVSPGRGKAAESEQARLGALKEVLDRGYGRPAQPMGSDPDEPIQVVIQKFTPPPVAL